MDFYVPHFSWNLRKSRNCNFVNFLAKEISFTKKITTNTTLVRTEAIKNTFLFYVFIEFLVFTIVCNIIRPRLMNVLNLGIISLCWSLDVMNPFLSPQLKKFGKIQFSSLSCRWALFTAWRSAASYFPKSWVKKTGFIFFLVDFHGRNWRILGFYENKIQHWALFSLKPTKVGFIFIGPNSLSRAKDLADVYHVIQAEFRIGS